MREYSATEINGEGIKENFRHKKNKQVNIRKQEGKEDMRRDRTG